MTVAEFIRKWSPFSGKESSAYQEHFGDLCAALAHPTPNAADPTGNDTFCYQKRVVKDAELFETADLFNTYAATDEARNAATRGFADVWLKGHFAWEYWTCIAGGKKKGVTQGDAGTLRGALPTVTCTLL